MEFLAFTQYFRSHQHHLPPTHIWTCHDEMSSHVQYKKAPDTCYVPIINAQEGSTYVTNSKLLIRLHNCSNYLRNQSSTQCLIYTQKFSQPTKACKVKDDNSQTQRFFYSYVRISTRVACALTMRTSGANNLAGSVIASCLAPSCR